MTIGSAFLAKSAGFAFVLRNHLKWKSSRKQKIVLSSLCNDVLNQVSFSAFFFFKRDRHTRSPTALKLLQLQERFVTYHNETDVQDRSVQTSLRQMELIIQFFGFRSAFSIFR